MCVASSAKAHKTTSLLDAIANDLALMTQADGRGWTEAVTRRAGNKLPINYLKSRETQSLTSEQKKPLW